jgi:predicted MFS family arabinose efflux permease
MNQSTTLGRTFQALRHPNYRMFLAGQSFSLAGNWMQLLAESWLIYRVTGSSFALGAISFVALLPAVPISFVGSALIDRMSKRKLVIVTESALALNALLWAFLAWSGQAQIWSLLLLTFLEGAIASIDLPARQAFLPEMVGMDDLPNTIALNQFLTNVGRIVGPGAAGLLIASVGEGFCFVLNGLSFLPVIASLFVMRNLYMLKEQDKTARSGSAIHGLSYLSRSPALIWLLALMAISHLFLLPYFTLLPAIAKDVVKAGPEGLGILGTSLGLGAMLGSLWLANIEAPKQQRLLVLSLYLLPVSIVVLASSSNLIVAAGIALIVGSSTTWMQTIFNTLVQLYVRDDMRGRTMGIYLLLQAGTLRGGAMGAGFLGDLFGGVPLALRGMAALSLIGTTIALRLRPMALREGMTRQIATATSD